MPDGCPLLSRSNAAHPGDQASKQARQISRPPVSFLPSCLVILYPFLLLCSNSLQTFRPIRCKNTYTPPDTIGGLQWMKTTLPPSTPKSPHRHSDGQTPPCHYCTPMQHPPSVRAYIRIYGCMWITTTAWPRCTWVDRMIDLYSQRKNDRHIEAFS